MNNEWAMIQLEQFIDATAPGKVPPGPGQVRIARSAPAMSEDELTQQSQVIEQILDMGIPNWRDLVASTFQRNKWSRRREAAIRAREMLRREEELKENLGENAPELSAAKLHPWVWGGAKSLWQSGHYRSAVDDAIKKVNAETQNKLGRRDVGEADLFKQAFSLDPPSAGRPRLRRMQDTESPTYKNMQRGAMTLAEGIYAGIRNPFNHDDPKDIDEQLALEYLAAVSVLARWVDESKVESV